MPGDSLGDLALDDLSKLASEVLGHLRHNQTYQLIFGLAGS